MNNDEIKDIIKLLFVALVIIAIVMTIGLVLVKCIGVPEVAFLGGGYDKR